MIESLLSNFEKPYKFFITGTCTEVGKTFVTVRLLNHFNSLGLKTLGMKPIASGCNKVDDDPALIREAASFHLPYETICPFSFEEPISPHIAAQNCNEKITKGKVVEKINRFFKYDADVFIVEGVGGWSVPLNERELVFDIVLDLNIPVILVVGMKLGCQNHTLLTVESIKNTGANLIGWYANCIDPNMLELEKNIETLKARVEAPCLEIIPYQRQASGKTIAIV